MRDRSPACGFGARFGEGAGFRSMVYNSARYRSAVRALAVGLFVAGSLVCAKAGPNDEGDKALAAQKYDRAMALYRKAADGNDPWGQVNVGKMYENGQGVAKSPKQAAVWYAKAAGHGNDWAQNSLGSLYGARKQTN